MHSILTHTDPTVSLMERNQKINTFYHVLNFLK